MQLEIPKILHTRQFMIYSCFRWPSKTTLSACRQQGYVVFMQKM